MKNEKQAKKSIKLLKLAAFLRASTFYMPIVGLFFIDSGATLSMLVLSQVLYSFVTFIAELPTGIIADRVGQRSAVTYGYLFGVGAFGLAIGLKGNTGILAMYGVLALADAFISGSEQAYLYKTSIAAKSSYKKDYGSILGMQSIAFAASAAVAGILTYVFGVSSYAMLMSFTFISYVIAFGVSLNLVNDKNIQNEHSLEKAELKALKLARKSFDLARDNKVIRALLVISVLTLSGEYFLYSIYQPYFVDNKVPASFLGYILAMGAIANYFIVKNIYRLEKYLNFEKLVLYFNLTLAFVFLLIGTIKHPVILILGFVILKGLFNALSPIVSDYLQEQTLSSMRATVLSGVSFAQAIVSILVRILLAFIVGKLGVAAGLNAQAVYLAIGTVVAYRYMTKCDCVGKIQ